MFKPVYTFGILFTLTIIFFALAIVTSNGYAWINITATILTLLTLLHIPIIWGIIVIVNWFKRIFKK
jgi:hypothetical protein